MDAISRSGRNLSTRLTLAIENELADAGGDCQTCLARPNFEVRTGTGNQ